MAACVKYLRDDYLPSADSGGKWFFMGASLNPNPTIGALMGNSFQDPTGTVTAGQVVISGATDNPTFDTTGLDPTSGLFYLNSKGVFFHYEYMHTSDGDCTTYGDCFPVCDVARVIIELVPERCPGGAVVKNVCQGDNTTYDLRQEFESASPCGTINDYKDQSDSEVIGEISTGGSPLTLGDPGVTFTNYGNRLQNEFLNVSTFAPGTYVYTHTVNLLNDYPVDCTTCSENPSTATFTINITEDLLPGTRTHSPYLVLCDDPDCSAGVTELITSPGQTDGVIEYMGVYSSGDLNDPTFTFETISDLGVKIAPATSFTYAPYAAGGTEVTNGVEIADIELSLLNADPYKTYTFKYSVNKGTPCEQVMYFYIRLELASHAGDPPEILDYCWHEFVAAFPSAADGPMPLHDLLTDNPDCVGSWDIEYNPGGAGMLSAIPGGESTFNNWVVEHPTDPCQTTIDFRQMLDPRYAADGVPAGPVADENLGNRLIVGLNFSADYSGPNTPCPTCPLDSTGNFNLRITSGCSDVGTSGHPTTGTAYECAACTISDVWDLWATPPAGECGFWELNDTGSSTGAPVWGTSGESGDGAESDGAHESLDMSGAGGLWFIEYKPTDPDPNNNVLCPNSFIRIYINVTPCEACFQTLYVASNKFQITQFNDGNGNAYNSTNQGGHFAFPYNVFGTGQTAVNAFISDWQSWAGTVSCITSDQASAATGIFDPQEDSIFVSLPKPASYGNYLLGITPDGGGQTLHSFTNHTPPCTDCFTNGPTFSVSETVDQQTGVVTSITVNTDSGSCTSPTYFWDDGLITVNPTRSTPGGGTHDVNVVCADGCIGATSWTCTACAGTPDSLNTKYFGIDYDAVNQNDTDLRLVSFQYWTGSSYQEIITGSPVTIVDNSSYTLVNAGDGHPYYLTDAVTALNSYCSANDIHLYFSAIPEFTDPGAATHYNISHRYIKANFPDCSIPDPWIIVLDAYDPIGDTVWHGIELRPSTLGIELGGNDGPFVDYTNDYTATCTTCSDIPLVGRGIVDLGETQEIC